MHIAYLTPEYPHQKSSGAGGLGTSIKNLAHSLVNKGVTVTVFIYGQKEQLIFKEGGINFHFLKKREYKFFGWLIYRKYIQNYINRQIKNEGIEILEAPDWTGITALMNINCPVVIRLNGSDAYFCHLEGRKQKWKNFFFEKRALRSADAIVSVSKFTGEVTGKIFGIPGPIPVIPNSIDVESFFPSEKRVVKNQLLYFGTLIRKKGVLELAGIFNHIVLLEPHAGLLLIGRDVIDNIEGESTLQLFRKKLSGKAEQNLRYIPEVNYDEIKDHISASEVILLPSFAEALPMTWLETMALEKPLVTSDIGWAKEVMVDGKTGFTEYPANHKDFAGKVVHLLKNPVLAKEFGIAARQRVKEKFSTQVVVEQNLKFYDKIIEKEKNA